MRHDTVIPHCDSDHAMISRPMGEHTLDQPTRRQICRHAIRGYLPLYERYIIFSYARRGPDTLDVAQSGHTRL